MDTIDKQPLKDKNQPEMILPGSIENNEIKGFGISMQGKSHKEKNNTPCQDYCDLMYLPQCSLTIAAIADGVGSCSQSHYGAKEAVKAAIEELKNAFEHNSYVQMNASQIEKLLKHSFMTAWSAVDTYAQSNERIISSYLSTLTVAIYDGDKIYVCHVGDDGVIARFRDGDVRLITERDKGEYANSVIPLESGEEHWHFTHETNVAGFIMATDGVLDDVARYEPEMYKPNVLNGVNYQKIKFVFDIHNCTEQIREKCLQKFANFQENGPVEDDMTLVGIISLAGLQDSQEPQFSIEDWELGEKRHQQEKFKILYPDYQKKLVSASLDYSQKVNNQYNGFAPETPAQSIGSKTRSGLLDRIALTKKAIIGGILLAAILTAIPLGNHFFHPGEIVEESPSSDVSIMVSPTPEPVITDGETSTEVIHESALQETAKEEIVSETETSYGNKHTLWSIIRVILIIISLAGISIAIILKLTSRGINHSRKRKQ